MAGSSAAHPYLRAENSPPHTSQEQLLLFQLLITDGEGFQSDHHPPTPPALLPLLYLWLIVSLVDCVCLSPPLSFFMLRLFLSLPPLPVSTAVLLLPHFPSLPLPARNSTVQFKSITPKPLTECGIHGNRY